MPRQGKAPLPTMQRASSIRCISDAVRSSTPSLLHLSCGARCIVESGTMPCLGMVPRHCAEACDEPCALGCTGCRSGRAQASGSEAGAQLGRRSLQAPCLGFAICDRMIFFFKNKTDVYAKLNWDFQKAMSVGCSSGEYKQAEAKPKRRLDEAAASIHCGFAVKIRMF